MYSHLFMCTAAVRDRLLKAAGALSQMPHGYWPWWLLPEARELAESAVAVALAKCCHAGCFSQEMGICADPHPHALLLPPHVPGARRPLLIGWKGVTY